MSLGTRNGKEGMRGISRWAVALLFGLTMFGILLSPAGRVLEKEYGLPLLYALRGPVAAPPEAMVIGLDNRSVRWLNARAIGWYNDPDSIHQSAPGLAECMPESSWQALLGAANINHIPRPVHACLVDALAARGARLISFDINFNKDRQGDAVLAGAIARAGNVLLFERFADDDGIELRSQPKAMFREAAIDTMAFRVDSARGQMVTGYRLRYDLAGDLRAMPDRAWSAYTGEPLPQAVEGLQWFWLYGPPLSVRTVPLMNVFDPGAAAMPEDMSNVVVFIGSSDPEDASIDDHFPVPTSGRGNRLIGGVELAATAFLNRLHGTQLQRLPAWAEGLVAFLVAVLGTAIVFNMAGWKLVWGLGLLALGWLAVSGAAFAGAQLWLPVAVPVFLTSGLLVLGALSVRYMFVRTLVERLAPRQVASTLLGGTDADRRTMRTEQATVMFIDLIGSTGMAESLDEFTYSGAISQYYETATGVVEAHGGMVVEFMGDGVLAMFSQSVSGPRHAARACAAASALLSRVAEDNSQVGADTPELGLRIGINTGLTATGDIGAKHRFNFKALGDVVNVAARLEHLAKEIGDQGRGVILLSEATKDAALLPGESLEALGFRKLRGRRDAVNIFRLL